MAETMKLEIGQRWRGDHAYCLPFGQSYYECEITRMVEETPGHFDYYYTFTVPTKVVAESVNRYSDIWRCGEYRFRDLFNLGCAGYSDKLSHKKFCKWRRL